MDFGEGSFLIDVLEEGWKVMIGHMLESEFPETGVLVWIEGGVISRVFVSPVISEPHIVAFISQHKSRRLILIIDQEGI